MASSREKLPTYRHHKASGQAVVCLSGKDIYLGPHGTKLSRDNYDRVVGEWLAAGRTLPKPADNKAANALLLLINAFRKADVIPTSHADEYKSVMALLVRLYGRSSSDDFGPIALKVVRAEMVKAGLRRKTINQRVHMIRRIIRWGVEHQMVKPETLAALKAVEPLRKGKTTAPESKTIKPVDAAHVEACIKFMTPTVAAMVRLQMLTGMRAGEVTQMRTGDIDTTTDPWTYRPGSHKTAHLGKVREIPLGPKAVEVLQPWLKTDLGAYLFSPAQADRERRDALEANRKTPAKQGNRRGMNLKRRPKKLPGECYNTPNYRQAIEYATARAFPLPAELDRRPKKKGKKRETMKEWRARLGTKWASVVAFRKSVHWHPHQLRHTYATTVRKLFGLDHAQKVLGHSNSAVTERYAAVAWEKAAEVAKAIG